MGAGPAGTSFVESHPEWVIRGTDFVTEGLDTNETPTAMAFHAAEVFLSTLIVIGGPWLAVTVGNTSEESEMG